MGCRPVIMICVASWIAPSTNLISTGSPTATSAFNLETLLNWISIHTKKKGEQNIHQGLKLMVDISQGAPALCCTP